jgi:CheY-like chemotaxis protein
MTGTATILLVEDDEIEAEAVTRAFGRCRIANPIRYARDGLEALDILRGTNGQTVLEGPYIILLDINMPRMNGLEFLDTIRADSHLKRAIVFMLTTSSADEDMTRAYEKNVAGYIVKNRAGDGFLKAVTMLDHYWRVVELPKE